MQSIQISGKRRLSPMLLLAVVAVGALMASLAAAVPEPCTVSGGAPIQLSGNHGFCYLVGRRMRKGSIFAQCKNGVLTCYADEGIPDKSKQEVDCVAPEAGNCGSSTAATPAPTPTAAANASASGVNATNASASGVNVTNANVSVVAGDAEFTERTRSIDEVNDLNPSALVSGNIEVPGLDDDEEDEDDA